MAERQERDTGIKITGPRKGLFTDTSHEQQPQGTYPFALNAVDDSTEGDIFALSNENSNIECASVPDSYILLGNAYMEDGMNVLFYVDNDTGNSIISTLDKNCKLVNYVTSDCLGFNRNYPIEASFRVRNGCERIIYWVDHLNPDRHLNLDDLDTFIRDDYDEVTDPEESKWYCPQFNVDKLTEPVCIEFISLNENGGNLPSGALQLAVQHLDENLNGAGYCDPTPVIAIIDDFYSQTYSQITGCEAGTTTNKSVTTTISNIDTNYAYLEIVAILTVNGVTTHYSIENLPINGASMEYTLTGILDSSTVIPDISYVKNVYSSKTITQLENRLIRGNIKAPSRDFTSLQALANDIQTFYYTKNGRADDTTNPRKFSAKQGSYYYDNRSYMRDEVYAFGIYYIYEDGDRSPVFHIPGREKNKFADGATIPSADPNNGGPQYHPRYPVDTSTGGWDDCTYEVVTNGLGNKTDKIDEHEVAHLGLSAANSDTVERWKVFNTARKDTTLGDSALRPLGEYGFTDLESTGTLAYHECDTATYPTTQDCDGNYIYGDLAGEKIRHHRMPDASLELHYKKDGFGRNIYPLGIAFDNISLPAGVVGYKIVRADRTPLNKTVLDKGIGYFGRKATISTGDSFDFQAAMMNKHYPTTANLDTYVPAGAEAGALLGTVTSGVSSRQDKIAFHSAYTKFIGAGIKPSHIKSELLFEADIDAIGPVGATAGEGGGYEAIYDNVTQIRINSKCNIPITQSSYIGANTIDRGTFSRKKINNFQQETLWLESNVDSVILDENNVDVGIQADLAIYDTGTNNSDYVGYYSLKASGFDVYTNLENLIYLPVSVCMQTQEFTTEFGGDIFIARMDFNQTFRAEFDGSVTTYFEALSTGVTTWNYSNLVTYWAESEVNSELRHELPDQTFYPKSHTLTLWDDFLEPALQGGNYIPNYYNYNTDYSLNNREITFIQLPLTWNYCSDCLNEFTNRVVYSERSYQEELADHYLNTLINNYKDINSNRGGITKLFNFKNTLFVDTEESRFVLPSTSKAIKVSEETINLGTGEFFSLPVQEIVDSDIGYLGNQSQWAMDITENGVFSIDAEAGNIFLYTKGIQNLASPKYGMHGFFKEHLPLNLPAQYEDLKNGVGSNPNYIHEDSPVNPYNGIGYTSVYDARNERWILTKHDYRLTALGESYVQGTTVLVGGVLVPTRMDIVDGTWTIFSGLTSYEITPHTRPLLFEDIGWTISFSMKRSAWISFHSYRPTNYISSKLHFLSVDNKLQIGIIDGQDTTGIWKHGEKFSYQNFYGTIYPHIIEMVESSNPLETRVYDSIGFVTKAKQWDSTNNYFVDKRLITFDKAILYNNYQSSGELTLVTKRDDTTGILQRSQEYVQTEALLDINERTFSFNNFRDMVGDYDVPLFTKNWGNSDYQSNYYIDKIINPSAINLNKNWWEQDVFRGKHLTLRLFFSIFDNVKLSTQVKVFQTNTTAR